MGALDLGGAEFGSLTVEFGSLLGDEIKFKKIDEMWKIRDDLMLFDPIAKLAREIYAQLNIELLAQDIKKGMRETAKRSEAAGETGDNTDGFYELLGVPNSVRFTAGKCTLRDDKVELSDEDQVLVTEYDTDSKQPVNTLRCTMATLHTEGDELAYHLDDGYPQCKSGRIRRAENAAYHSRLDSARKHRTLYK